mmetsp:Transcript_4799/g.12318  ORF Transcript_4799/g.12318 Transcript_4799/m.12318 type:complete len:135 (+) Transcript_4799:234-638(+)
MSVEGGTRYLLHGTRASHLPSIVRHGLRTKFSPLQPNTTALYGRGEYFTDSTCKAWQYTDRRIANRTGSAMPNRGVILLCRVTLGKAQLFAKAPTDKLFSDPGFHSAMAKHGHTMRSGVPQIYTEFVVYDDWQV